MSRPVPPQFVGKHTQGTFIDDTLLITVQGRKTRRTPSGYQPQLAGQPTMGTAGINKLFAKQGPRVRLDADDAVVLQADLFCSANLQKMGAGGDGPVE